MKLCEFVDCCLSSIGVEKIFGIPGALVMPIWQNLKDKDIVLCSHEQEASYVATGYAKVSKKPVCVITTGGPGVTNCISGIASANIDSVPLIYISGRTPISKQGFGLRQEESKTNRMYDSVEVLGAITKQSVCIVDIETAPQLIWETMKSAVCQRQGAIHISIPIDMQNSEVDEVEIKFFSKDKPHKRDIIPISKRPIFVLGWGAWMSGAFTKVYELAEKINAPVLVSSKAYCCIDKNNKMFLGKLGYGYNLVIDEFIDEYNPDSIISFGSSLGEKDIKGTVIQLLKEVIPTYIIADDCSYVLERNSKEIGIELPDMCDCVEKICKTISERVEDEELVKKINMTKEKSYLYWSEKILPNDTMAKCIKEINDLCDDQCVVFADAGNNLANAGALIMPTNSGQMFIDVGLRAMGTGICTAVGMAIADRRKVYIAITGDGCMMMNGNIMHLASEMNLPVIFVVFNNQSLGRVRVGQSIMNDYRGTDIKNVNYISYAEAFNIKAFSCDSLAGLSNIFKSCISSKKISVIEVITGKDEIPVSVKDNIY